MFFAVNYEKGKNILFPLRENAFFFLLLLITLKKLTERVISNPPFFLCHIPFLDFHRAVKFDKLK